MALESDLPSTTKYSLDVNFSTISKKLGFLSAFIDILVLV